MYASREVALSLSNGHIKHIPEAYFSKVQVRVTLSSEGQKAAKKAPINVFFNVLICFSPNDQMMAAMPIVLNFDSRGLSGFIIALYLNHGFN